VADVTTTQTSSEFNPARMLSEIFDIDWDPQVMQYEEPHLFKSVTVAAVEKGNPDAER
jgi:hypothetical protein